MCKNLFTFKVTCRDLTAFHRHGLSCFCLDISWARYSITLRNQLASLHFSPQFSGQSFSSFSSTAFLKCIFSTEIVTYMNFLFRLILVTNISTTNTNILSIALNTRMQIYHIHTNQALGFHGVVDCGHHKYQDSEETVLCLFHI